MKEGGILWCYKFPPESVANAYTLLTIWRSISGNRPICCTGPSSGGAISGPPVCWKSCSACWFLLFRQSTEVKKDVSLTDG